MADRLSTLQSKHENQTDHKYSKTTQGKVQGPNAAHADFQSGLIVQVMEPNHFSKTCGLTSMTSANGKPEYVELNYC